MERAIAEMEKIRRAEEIYARRNSDDLENKKRPKSLYKFLFEMLILIDIVIIVLAVQNQNYIFTDEFIKQVNSYNVNIKNVFENIFKTSPEEQNEIEKNVPEEQNDNVPGEVNIVNSALVENEEEELSQEQKDVNEIRNNYSIILPIEGIKTSGFGERESNNSKVTKYHTGVDIGAAHGTVIKSAISGKVIQVSDSGDYGKHIKIQTGDLVILYAHCSKIYLKEGQNINQGDNVGEVGSTGNSTGPHLHFEIRLYDRYINPESILEIN